MGVFRTDIRLTNPVDGEASEANAPALVDTGAMHLCIPERLRAQLGLRENSRRPVRIASGETLEAPYVGPVKVSVMGRDAFTGAMVLGDEVLLGAIPLEDLDLHVDPRGGRLIPNPKSPDRPMSLAMGVSPAGASQDGSNA